jgi:hypothetical protein
MKIKKFNENMKFVPSDDKFVPSDDNQMISYISSLMLDFLDTRHIPYTENDVEIDQRSVLQAATKILSELKDFGVDFDLIYNTKKYNL